MPDQPNILLILADQLSWKALPAYGNAYAQTPNLDRLAGRGVRFDQCYTSCPLCQPARPSLWTGRYPHEHGVLSNGRNFPVDPVPDSFPTLGEIFSQAGYRTVHFGKQHDAGGLRGFQHVEPQGKIEIEGPEPWPYHYDTHRDQYTTAKTTEFLQDEADKQPYLCVADLQNPHDICNWVGDNQGVHDDVPVPGDLPPLPDNFETTDLDKRPIPVQYVCCTHNRLCQAAQWTKENYRHYLAAYYHYCQRLDQDVGRILDALDQRDDAGNTIVVFLADHGDGMAAHRMVTKQVVLYDEVTRVPLIAAGPGIADSGQTNHELVSLLDVLPTLCELAGTAAPTGLWGQSLMPQLTGDAPSVAHEYTVSEWHTEWGFTVSPGRMVRTQDYKYMRYLEGNGEELYHVTSDPGETRTLIDDPRHAQALDEHRKLLGKHLQKTDDPFLSMEWYADQRWRSHPVGYPNHRGPTAPMEGS